MIETKAQPQVFLCYAREDVKKVEDLYQELARAGIKPWMDIYDILPGEKWENRIQQAIRESDLFLACLSTKSINKRGFLQKEIKDALDTWREKVEGDIYLIPVRLEACEVPESLRVFQWANLFDLHGMTQLLQSIQTMAKRLIFDEEIDKALKTTKTYIDPKYRVDFGSQVSQSIALMENLISTFSEVEEYISPERKLEFERNVTACLKHIIEEESKFTHTLNTEEWNEIAPKWRNLYRKIEIIARRLDLLDPAKPQVFIKTLWWLSEQGGEEDLDILIQLEKNPPFSSREIEKLIEVTKQRINERILHHKG
jgi:flagellin-specific chaperone FliS